MTEREKAMEMEIKRLHGVCARLEEGVKVALYQSEANRPPSERFELIRFACVKALTRDLGDE